ncbi:hypothetical protein [Luminiphilus syltensis]|nr:hypothetical protein [Luminiphilus syltensis]
MHDLPRRSPLHRGGCLMPALTLLGAIVLSAGATAVAIALLGPDASEQQRECVEALVEALEPRTKRGVQEIVGQCRERYGE